MPITEPTAISGAASTASALASAFFPASDGPAALDEPQPVSKSAPTKTAKSGRTTIDTVLLHRWRKTCLAPNQSSRAIGVDRLLKLFFGVHDEWTAPGHGL